MITVHLHKRDYDLPQTLNELNGRQLVAVMNVFLENPEMDLARLKLLKILMGVGWMQFARIPVEEKADVLHHTDFLLTDKSLTRQLIPIYKGFHGPAEDFNNLLMEEFVFAEDFYLRYAESKRPVNEGEEPGMGEERLLDDLISVLYRKPKAGYDLKINPDGDGREPFNENVCRHSAAAVISGWPMGVKLAILTWYSCCREKMVQDNPEVFGGSGGPAKYGLLSIMRSIAESGVHGDFDKVAKKHVKIIMMELNEKVEDNKRLEKQNKQ